MSKRLEYLKPRKRPACSPHRIAVHPAIHELTRMIADGENTFLGDIVWIAVCEYYLNHGGKLSVLRKMLRPQAS